MTSPSRDTEHRGRPPNGVKDDYSIEKYKSSLCPFCGSCDSWKNGHRPDGTQRWLCKNCGGEYGERTQKRSELVRMDSNEPLNSAVATLESAGEAEKHAERRVGGGAGAEEREMQSLRNPNSDLLKAFPVGIRAKILEFAVKRYNENYADVEKLVYTLRMLHNLGANLYDPESVKAVIKPLNIEDSSKKVYCRYYEAFLTFLGGTWDKPRYNAVQKKKQLALEEDLDTLIAAVSKRTGAFLQTLKETGARPGEILGLKWDDIDFERRLLAINDPEKGSNSRRIKVSPKLLKMLGRLPRKSDRVFPTNYHAMYSAFDKQRAKASYKLANPKLKKITFKTFRDWRFTMEAHRVHGNMLKVQGFTGHKAISSVMKYIIWEQEVYGESEYDEFDVVYAETRSEFFKYLQDGYDVVTDYGLGNPKVLKKRK